MNADQGDACVIPNDPTFTKKSYDQMADALLYGFLGFLLLAVIGVIVGVYKEGYLSFNTILKQNPRSEYWTVPQYFGYLFGGGANAFILMGIAFMVAATLSRTIITTVYFFKGGERVLGTVTVLVMIMLVGCLLLARYW